MKHIKGDLLQALEDGSVDVIMHQVNCVGAMNSGIAKKIRQDYPQHFTDYTNTLAKMGRDIFFGSYVCTELDDCKIVGVAGQYHYGKDGRYTNYSALVKAICDFLENHDDRVIGLPKYIGCGLGGGDWNIVEQLLIDIEMLYGIEFMVYEL